MERILRIPLAWILILLMGLTLPLTSCKSKKKQAEEQARLEAEAKAKERDAYIAQLNKLTKYPISDMNEWEEKYAAFKDLVFKNPFKGEMSVEGSIAKVESFFQAEKERLESLVEETQDVNDYEDPNKELKIEIRETFNEIVQADSYEEANQLINSLLPKFASSETPVLIVIDQEGMDKAYDRPTTAEKFLNYLKDQKRNPYSVLDVLVNRNGKIQSMELLLNK